MFKDLFSAAKPDQAAASQTPVHPAASESIIGAGADFTGTVFARSGIRIEGTLTGDALTESRVVIGETAAVTGDIIAEAVTVGGMVRGNVTARRVSILRTGRLLGDLRLERLSTEEGAFLQGQVRMEQQVDVAEALAPFRASGEPASASQETLSTSEAASAPVPIKTGAPASKR